MNTTPIDVDSDEDEEVETPRNVKKSEPLTDAEIGDWVAGRAHTLGAQQLETEDMHPEPSDLSKDFFRSENKKKKNEDIKMGNADVHLPDPDHEDEDTRMKKVNKAYHQHWKNEKTVILAEEERKKRILREQLHVIQSTPNPTLMEYAENPITGEQILIPDPGPSPNQGPNPTSPTLLQQAVGGPEPDWSALIQARFLEDGAPSGQFRTPEESTLLIPQVPIAVRPEDLPSDEEFEAAVQSITARIGDRYVGALPPGQLELPAHLTGAMFDVEQGASATAGGSGGGEDQEPTIVDSNTSDMVVDSSGEEVQAPSTVDTMMCDGAGDSSDEEVQAPSPVDSNASDAVEGSDAEEDQKLTIEGSNASDTAERSSSEQDQKPATVDLNTPDTAGNSSGEEVGAPSSSSLISNLYDSSENSSGEEDVNAPATLVSHPSDSTAHSPGEEDAQSPTTSASDTSDASEYVFGDPALQALWVSAMRNSPPEDTAMGGTTPEETTDTTTTSTQGSDVPEELSNPRGTKRPFVEDEDEIEMPEGMPEDDSALHLTEATPTTPRTPTVQEPRTPRRSKRLNVGDGAKTPTSMATEGSTLQDTTNTTTTQSRTKVQEPRTPRRSKRLNSGDEN